MNRQIRRRVAALVKKAEAKGIVLRKNDPSTPTLEELVVKLTEHGFKAPRQFQRPLSWKKSNKLKYFESVLMNRIEGSVVIVNVVKALAALKKATPSTDNEAYTNYNKCIELFEECLEEGKKFIALDGNNRLSFYMALITGEYRIPEGTYEYIQDKNDSATNFFTVTRKANTFNDLPELVQEAIYDRVQVVSEYTQADWYGMSQVFINTNTMVAPNEQELRNASVSDWGEYVYNIRESNINLLSMMFKDPITRLYGDEWITGCLDFAIQAVEPTEEPVTFESEINQDRVDSEGKSIAEVYTANVKCHPINQESKWNLYDSELVDNAETYQAIFTSLTDWVSKLVDEASTDKEKKHLKTKSFIQNLFWMMCNGIETYEEAVEAAKLHQEAYADNNVTYGEDQATFKNACSGTGLSNIEFRYIILSRIVGEVSLKFSSDVNFNEEFKLEVA